MYALRTFLMRSENHGVSSLLVTSRGISNTPTMFRPLRIEFADALYHITSRGDRREAIYEDDEDREAFLDVLEEVVVRYNGPTIPFVS